MCHSLAPVACGVHCNFIHYTINVYLLSSTVNKAQLTARILHLHVQDLAFRHEIMAFSELTHNCQNTLERRTSCAEIAPTANAICMHTIAVLLQCVLQIGFGL